MSYNRETAIKEMNVSLTAWNLKDQREKGLGVIYDNWYEAKSNLRELFRNHSNWNEDTQSIAVDTEIERTSDIAIYRELMLELYQRVSSIIYHDVWPDDIYCIYDQIRSLPSIIAKHHISAVKRVYMQTPDKEKIRDELVEFMKPGMKLSKVVNKFCQLFGFDTGTGTITNSQGAEVSWYNKWFARISDSLSTKNQKVKLVLSIHPCDYINMSRGTGWRSCHNMNEGSWRAGCLSYMLDDITAVCYTIVPDDEEQWFRTKINRQLYMIKNDTMLASRLYPDNDDDTRKELLIDTVQKIISECKNVPNDWRFVASSDGDGDYSEYSERVLAGEGSCQYHDYLYEDYATRLYVRNGYSLDTLFIGTFPRSLSVGVELRERDTYDIFGNFVECAECGELIEMSDAIIIDGKYYCEEHTFNCEICNEYHLLSDRHEGTNYCERCWKKHTATCQFCGEVKFKTDLIRYRNKDGRYASKYACNCCVPTDIYDICESCGSYHKKEFTSKFECIDGTANLCPACAEVMYTWIKESK